MVLMANGMPMGIQVTGGDRGNYHPESGMWYQDPGHPLARMEAEQLLARQVEKPAPDFV
jgi:hypothetical protein